MTKLQIMRMLWSIIYDLILYIKASGLEVPDKVQERMDAAEAASQTIRRGVEMDKNVNYIKGFFTMTFSLLTSLFGVLAIPILLMVGTNIIDYATGLIAAPKRSEDINSYKSMRGIWKKVCMWLLVAVGAIIDELILYASGTIGITLPGSFLVACVVACWIICNEILSILENLKDIGIAMPPFLEPLVKNIKSQTADKVTTDKGKE